METEGFQPDIEHRSAHSLGELIAIIDGAAESIQSGKKAVALVFEDGAGNTYRHSINAHSAESSDEPDWSDDEMASEGLSEPILEKLREKGFAVDGNSIDITVGLEQADNNIEELDEAA